MSADRLAPRITARQLRNGLAFLRAAQDNLRLAKHYLGEDWMAGPATEERCSSIEVLIMRVKDREQAVAEAEDADAFAAASAPKP